MDPMPPFRHHKPVEIAPDTFLIRELTGEGTPSPVNVYINSLVIRGQEPVIVDTGTYGNRKQWLDDVFALVEPKDVRWIFVSHDDHDHVGNLRQALELCPNATLVGNWFMVERLGGDIALPLPRMLWLNDGESFQAGDRTLTAIRPPIYDSPTTRGLFDAKTGVYWGSDCFATPVIEAVEEVGDLDPEFWVEGFNMFQRMVSPWHEVADEAKFAAQVNRLERLPITTIAGGHGPVSRGSTISRSYELLKQLPRMEAAQLPGQAQLEAIVAMMMQPEPGTQAAA